MTKQNLTTLALSARGYKEGMSFAHYRAFHKPGVRSIYLGTNGAVRAGWMASHTIAVSPDLKAKLLMEGAALAGGTPSSYATVTVHRAVAALNSI